MKTPIKDRNYRVIGYIVEESSGKRVEDARGNFLGRYLEAGDKTIDGHGRFIGEGDQLRSLVA